MKNLLMLFLVSTCLQSTSAMLLSDDDRQARENLTRELNNLVDYALDEEFPSGEYIKDVVQDAYDLIGDAAFDAFCYSLPEKTTRRQAPIVERLTSEFHDALIEIENNSKAE